MSQNPKQSDQPATIPTCHRHIRDHHDLDARRASRVSRAICLSLIQSVSPGQDSPLVAPSLSRLLTPVPGPRAR